jgi:pimeloyl-ACP methyl ester carboxylesterase
MRVASFALTLILAWVPPVVAQQPEAPTIVIVHGAWGGSWGWRGMESLLEGMGHKVYRPSLTGQGERFHLASPEIDLGVHIDDVVNVIEFEELEDIILLGHSYGGMVVTGVAERLPERIRHLVYLDAFVPFDGESLVTSQGKTMTEFMTDWATKGALNNPGFVTQPNVPPPDSPAPRIVPQPIGTFTEPIHLFGDPGNGLPASYIHTREAPGAEDGFDRYADRARELGWTMYEMIADHLPQRSKPKELAELLTEIR